MIRRLLALLYPPKCVFCGRLLQKEETDLCAQCRRSAPYVERQESRVPFSDGSYAVVYYEGTVRESILRYKFLRHRSYALAYGRLLAMKVAEQERSFDLVTHVPVSRKRRRQRGYDQAELIAQAVARELGLQQQKLLQKIRNNPAQSGLRTPEQRRANVLGVYRADRSRTAGKNILLIDDVMTTGATLSECCRTLLDAGAATVCCAALACTRRNNNSR